MSMSAAAERELCMRRRIGEEVDELINVEMLGEVPRKLKLVRVRRYGKNLHALLDV